MGDSLKAISSGVISFVVGVGSTLVIFVECLKHSMWKIAKEKEPELRSVLSFFSGNSFVVFMYRRKQCSTKEIESFRILARNINIIIIICFILGFIMMIFCT